MKRLVLILFYSSISLSIYAQDLEPRFLSSSPTGTNFTGAVYSFSSGNILLNGLEVENLNAEVNTMVAFYGRSFKLFNCM